MVGAISTQWREFPNVLKGQVLRRCCVKSIFTQITLMDQNNLIKSSVHSASRDKFRQSQIGAVSHPTSASHSLNNCMGAITCNIYRKLHEIGIKGHQKSPPVCCLVNRKACIFKSVKKKKARLEAFVTSQTARAGAIYCS